MQIESLSFVMFAVGIGVISYAGYVALRPEEQAGEGEGEKPAPVKGSPKRENTTLAAIAPKWAIRKPTGVVYFVEIAKLWRQDIDPDKDVISAPPLNNPELLKFWIEDVERRPTVKGKTKALIGKILEILDTQGNCPSVVGKNKSDKESDYGDDLYLRLATIPLWDHTLAVTRAIIKRMSQPMMVPDAMIVGLAHDLGKISSYQNAYYRTGDHPTLSLIVLAGIDEFKSLKNRDELSTVIRDHHTKVATENSLLRALRDADTDTRYEEIARIGSDPDLDISKKQGENRKKRGQSAHEKSVKNSPVSAPISPSGGSERQLDGEAAPESRIGILSIEEVEGIDFLPPVLPPSVPEFSSLPGEATDSPPDFVPIPQFLSPVPAETSSVDTLPVVPEQGIDPDVILNAMKPHINAVDNGRWSIIAMQDGFVYALKEFVWSTVAEIYPDHAQVTSAIVSEAAKDMVMRELVTAWVKSGKAHKEWLTPKKGFITTPVIIITGADNKEIKMMMVPFLLHEAFGMRCADLEYTPYFRRMVKGILPRPYKKEKR